LSHQYRLDNRHRQTVTVQVLEPSPVSEHESLQLQSRFDPLPTETGWRQLPGVVLWQLPLNPGQSLSLKADYQLSAPKDARVEGWR